MHLYAAGCLATMVTALRLHVSPEGMAPASTPLTLLRQRTSRVVAQYSSLPSGWQEFRDEQGNVYYGNTQTGETQWNMPTSLTLPPGWQMCYDEQGLAFYAHVQTGQTQWEQPTDIEANEREVLDAVARAEERLRQSVEYSPCNGPSMEALEDLEAADERAWRFMHAQKGAATSS